MSEVHRQRKRIDHIMITCGTMPTALDVSELEMEGLIDELSTDRRYRYPVPVGVDDFRETMRRNGFDLFGVRFVKGRV